VKENAERSTPNAESRMPEKSFAANSFIQDWAFGVGRSAFSSGPS
jgi:hypothetical protein